MREAHVECKAITLEKHPEVRIFAQHRMVRNLLNAFLQSEPALPYKLVIKSSEGILFRNWRNHDPWVVVGKSFV
jgi:hypothetical protein